MNMARKMFFSSESVTEGHPDKVCDQISDAILDAALADDPNARVACEVMVSTGLVFVAGEITTTSYIDIPQVVRNTIQEIGYTDHRLGFDADSCAVLTSIDEQSPDIAIGVAQGYEKRMGETDDELSGGAGDQGIMFGFANKDTPELMPLPISLAHKLAKQLAVARKTGQAKTFLPDGKSQVTIAYEDDRPVHIDTVVISTQHRESSSLQEVEQEVLEYVLKPVLPADLYDKKTRVLINPTGRFVLGGPEGDTGVTGRKIVVDTYGGFGRHGGGALSGKDPTKVDRSATYAARYVAKNIVAADLADSCEVQIAYAIGVAKPVSIFVDTFGTGKIADQDLEKIVRANFDLRPQAIINDFDLLKPIYKQTAAYGHLGRTDIEFPWEKTDKADLLKFAAQRFG
jgi:S-adenosylmethionine synthetase